MEQYLYKLLDPMLKEFADRECRDITVQDDSLGFASAISASCWASPNSAFMVSCSCSDRMVEPLLALTFFAYRMTKTMEIASVTSHSTTPSMMMVPWLITMPDVLRESTAAPTANGLTVEPSTPQPAPNSTTAAPTTLSKPAATMVAASSR